MTLDEHLTCPRCGYDLYGIPALRCPECGFYYDAEALRSLTWGTVWTHYFAARQVTLRAVLAAAFAVPSLCGALGLVGLGQGFVIAACYSLAFIAWRVFSDAPNHAADIPSILNLFVGFGLVVALVVLISPTACVVAAGVLLATAWYGRLRRCPPLPSACDERSRAVLRIAGRAGRMGDCALCASALLVLAALWL
ncbi:MAG: hypothetical protein HY763_04765 [Planctomycetes bacterium]|nr:hypothetical protein [Planctomycetota bacterium]